MRRRIEKLEKQQPERKVVFIWDGDPLPADADKDDLIIRFVWRDQTVKEKKRDKVVS